MGETIRLGYFEQHPPEVPADLKMVDYIRGFVEVERPKGMDVIQAAERADIAKTLASAPKAVIEKMGNGALGGIEQLCFCWWC